MSHSMSRPFRNPVQSGTIILETGNAVMTVFFFFFGAVVIFLSEKKWMCRKLRISKGDIILQRVPETIRKEWDHLGRQCGFTK